MKAKKFLTILLLSTSTLVVSCVKADSASDEEESEQSESGIDVKVDASFNTNSQSAVSAANAVTITYSGNQVTVNNPYSDKGVSITVSNADIVVKSTITSPEINYVLSGNTTAGSFKIYSDCKLGLVFNGISIINTKGPAFNIQSEKKATITLVAGTNSRAVDSSTYPTSEEDQKGAIFSEGQIEVTGTGSLTIVGRHKHGICSDDYLLISGGNISVTAAAADGIHANDYVQVSGGSLNLNTIGEGIESEEGYVRIDGGAIKIITTGVTAAGIKGLTDIIVNNCTSMDISVSGAGSKCLSADGKLTIADGKINLNTSGTAIYDTQEADVSCAAGIKCDSDLKISGGDITITSTGAAGKGINVDGTLTVDNGSISVTTSGGQFTYGMDASSAKAIKSDGILTLNGGTITVKTSGKGAEGIESKQVVNINGGDVSVEAYDDCINATSQININGGKIYCYSINNDGIDSNGPISVSGGTILSIGTNVPEEGLDCDQSTFKITGGTIIGLGGAASTPTAGVSTQRSILYGAGSTTQNQIIYIKSSTGSDLLSIKIPRAYTQLSMLFSSAGLAQNTTYTIYKGGSLSGGTDFHGLYTGATCSGGTAAITFTPTSIVTNVGSATGGGGGAGEGGGIRP